MPGDPTIGVGLPGEPAAPAGAGRLGFRRGVAAVLVALVAGSAATSFLVRRVIVDQEERLLVERATKTAGFLSSLFAREATSLSLLVKIVGTDAGPDVLAAASEQILAGAPGRITRFERGIDGSFAVAGVGGAPPGATGARGDGLARRATVVRGLVVDATTLGGERVLRFAVPDVTGTRVVVLETPISGFSWLRPGPGTPFGSLHGAFYEGTIARPEALVFSTGSDLAPGRKGTVQRSVAVGGDTWHIVVRARHSLLGDVARFAWLLVLASGLVTAGLVVALVAVMGRRRAYALALVDQRTAALRDALAKRERAEAGERRAREEAEAANRSKTEFLSRMSHELRTPLNAVIGFAQLLELDCTEPSQRDAVEQILRGGRHLLTLVDEVLDISRIETGSLSLSTEAVHAWRAIEEVVDLTRPLAAQRGIQLLCSPHQSEEVYIRADAQRLRQVVLNLVSNAVKYNREGGLVDVACAREGPESLRISVADTGPGIASDQLDRLFTPFERLGAERTSVEGTGIGLALSWRLTEAMGSDLAVASEVGAGSTFSFVLPIVAPVGPGPPVPTRRGAGRAPGILDAPGVGRTVVHIENDEANLHLVAKIFGWDDVHVIPAAQGGLGIGLVRAHRPSLVLLDLHLPDLDGREVLARLHADPATASIPVVVLSADATRSGAERLRRAGAAGYLTKPIDVQRLRAVVAGIWAVAP